MQWWQSDGTGGQEFPQSLEFGLPDARNGWCHVRSTRRPRKMLNTCIKTNSLNSTAPYMLPGTEIEIRHDRRGRPVPKFALFDFDGTLSLIREGWQQIMIPMFVEELAATGTAEPVEELTGLVRRFVMELTGKQTIYQMLRLAEEVQARGGRPAEPLDYKHEYHRRLMARIEARREALRSGNIDPHELLVPGSLSILRELTTRGMTLLLASGTDENYVREEVALLGLTPWFEDRIYGAQDDYRRFSKQMVIERLLTENAVSGQDLVGFGDGYVEIENVRAVDGLAIAVASDEAGRSGRPDAWKRARLIEVDADIVIPDFTDARHLCNFLWDQPPVR